MPKPKIEISRPGKDGPVSVQGLIKEWMAKHDSALKHYEFAELFGVHPTYFSLMMNNKSSLFTDEYLEILSGVIGVPIEELLKVRYYRSKWLREQKRNDEEK